MVPTQALVPEKLHLTRPAPALRRAALVALALLLALSVAGFLLTVVASYYQNGLDAVPLSEVGGGPYDPSDLPFPPSDTVGLLGALFGLLVPVASGLGAIAVGLDLLVDGPPRPRADRVLEVALLVLCVVVFVAYLQVAQLSVWWTD